MDRLLPPDRPPAGVADDTELARLYAYPDGLDQPWVKVNFISSADGAVSLGGRSGGLSDANDKRVFRLGRTLSDVVLVGAGTATVERYRGIRRRELATDLRDALGLAPVPPIAVVSRRCSIGATSLLVTDTEVAPMVFTTKAATAQRRAAVAAAGAEVVIAGSEDVDLALVLAELGDRGLRRVCCEGGPTLFGDLIAADLVDELCLSVAPLLTAGDAGRIAHGPVLDGPVALRLAGVLHADDLLLLRYLRAGRNR
ncbi:MAG TPA: pyrimidine reductase family protein [Pseudonocardiaceae bacterium]|nr:pyrimidine reductase family protein [Pseudonocardiaceae bacterium]